MRSIISTTFFTIFSQESQQNLMWKVVTSSNLNPPLKLFFYSLKLANNNFFLKIYCENIVVAFFNCHFLFFILIFLSISSICFFFLFWRSNRENERKKRSNGDERKKEKKQRRWKKKEEAMERIREKKKSGGERKNWYNSSWYNFLIKKIQLLMYIIPSYLLSYCSWAIKNLGFRESIGDHFFWSHSLL